VLECKLELPLRRGRHCLIASSNWWKWSHSSIRRHFSWSTSWIRLRYTRSCSFPQIWLAEKFRDDFLAPYHFSCLSTLIKTRQSSLRKIDIPCLLFTLTDTLYWKPEICCHRYLKINNPAIRYFLVKFYQFFRTLSRGYLQRPWVTYHFNYWKPFRHQYLENSALIIYTRHCHIHTHR